MQWVAEACQDCGQVSIFLGNLMKAHFGLSSGTDQTCPKIYWLGVGVGRTRWVNCLRGEES